MLFYCLLKSGGVAGIQCSLSLINDFLITCLQILLAQFLIQRIELVLRTHGQLVTILGIQIIQSLVVLGNCIDSGCEQTVGISLACFVDSNLSIVVDSKLIS